MRVIFLFLFLNRHKSDLIYMCIATKAIIGWTVSPCRMARLARKYKQSLHHSVGECWNGETCNNLSNNIFPKCNSFVSFVHYCFVLNQVAFLNYYKFVCSELFGLSHVPVNSQSALRDNWSFVCVCSVSRPDTIVFPPPNWSPSQSLREEQDVGPEVLQVYEVWRDSAAFIRQKTKN